MAYDPARSMVLMHHGERADEISPIRNRETWEWDGADWRLSEGFESFCCPRRNGAMVYEVHHQRMLVFGGEGVDPNGTWALEPVWIPGSGIQVDPILQPSDYYRTIREGVAAASACCNVSVRVGDYNETTFGFRPFTINKAVRFDPYQFKGDSVNWVRIH